MSETPREVIDRIVAAHEGDTYGFCAALSEHLAGLVENLPAFTSRFESAEAIRAFAKELSEPPAAETGT